MKHLGQQNIKENQWEISTNKRKLSNECEEFAYKQKHTDYHTVIGLPSIG